MDIITHDTCVVSSSSPCVSHVSQQLGQHRTEQPLADAKHIIYSASLSLVEGVTNQSAALVTCDCGHTCTLIYTVKTGHGLIINHVTKDNQSSPSANDKHPF